MRIELVVLLACVPNELHPTLQCKISCKVCSRRVQFCCASLRASVMSSPDSPFCMNLHRHASLQQQVGHPETPLSPILYDLLEANPQTLRHRYDIFRCFDFCSNGDARFCRAWCKFPQPYLHRYVKLVDDDFKLALDLSSNAELSRLFACPYELPVRRSKHLSAVRH